MVESPEHLNMACNQNKHVAQISEAHATPLQDLFVLPNKLQFFSLPPKKQRLPEVMLIPHTFSPQNSPKVQNQQQNTRVVQEA